MQFTTFSYISSVRGDLRTERTMAKAEALNRHAGESVESVRKARLPKAKEVESVDEFLARGGTVSQCPPRPVRGLRTMVPHVPGGATTVGGSRGGRRHRTGDS